MPDPLDQPVAPPTPSADADPDDPDAPLTSRVAVGSPVKTPTDNGAEAERADGDGSGDDGGESDDQGGGSGDEPEAAKARQPRSRVRTLVEWAVVIGGALLVALVVRSTLAQAFWIPSPSMEPTLQEGDRVLVNKLSYRLHEVNRGDIVVFERPENAVTPGDEDEISDLIKRVIGLPGEVIESRDDGFVYIDGRRLDEPYLPEGTRTTGLERQTVPEGQLFMMGDNRGNSHDSRAFGPIDEDLIVGRAFIRIWPLDDIGGL